MTDRQDRQELEAQGPPETFVLQVKDALEHLYDLSWLQQHPLALAQGDRPATKRFAEITGQRLRQELAAAIEALNPGAGVPFYASQARLYNLLRLRYVEGRTVQETAHELGLSMRQAHRDLRRAEESVATILWTRRLASTPSEANTARQLSSLQAEMARLKAHPRPTDIGLLLQHAQEVVAPQASQRSVHFQAETPVEPVNVSTDPAIAKQVLVNTLSYAVQQSQPGMLFLALSAGEEQASLTLRYFPEPETTHAPVVSLVVSQLVNRLGWTIRQEDQKDGSRVIVLNITAYGPAVLVIDDNEGLVELLERYLTDQDCRVIAAANGQEGLRLAEELVPDAIVLDVMMPETHGWEVLQRVRHLPKTKNIPVVICSIINNPQLAYALGASLFLPKPVSRNDILTALRRLGVM